MSRTIRSDATAETKAKLQYLNKHVDPVLTPLLDSLLRDRPTEVAKYAIDALKKSTAGSFQNVVGFSEASGSELATSLANPDGASLRAFDDSYLLYNKLIGTECGERLLPADCAAFNASLSVLVDSFRLFGPDKVYGSFNGGKDAVAVLHLMRAAMAAYSVKAGRHFKPRFVYFTPSQEFPEVEAFVRETTTRYDLHLLEYDCGYVEGLSKCIDSHGSRSPLGFVLGTRCGDPNAKGQQTYSPSSEWMDPVRFMRINPVLEWNYGQVWKFLRTFELPYCSLYDDGYTSLGKVHDTERNPALKVEESRAYSAAYTLEDWSLERAGRGRDKSSTARNDKGGQTGAGSDEGNVSVGATILRGAPLSASILEEISSSIAVMVSQGVRPPCLAVVTIADWEGALDESGAGAAAAGAAKSYLAMATRAAKKCGVVVRHAPFTLPPPQQQQQSGDAAVSSSSSRFSTASPTSACAAWVASVGADPTVDALLLALPLPPARQDVDLAKVLSSLPSAKDVDAVSPLARANFLNAPPPSTATAAALTSTTTAAAASAPPSSLAAPPLPPPRFAPCTALSVMVLLRQVPNLDLKGKDVAVVGATGAVGQPLTRLLLEAGATVTCLHVDSCKPHAHAARADVVVACAGRAGLVHAGRLSPSSLERRDDSTSAEASCGSWVKAGAVVIDVGINIVTVAAANAGGDTESTIVQPGIVGDALFEPVSSALGPKGFITPVPGGVGPVTAAILMQSTLRAAVHNRQQQKWQNSGLLDVS